MLLRLIYLVVSFSRFDAVLPSITTSLLNVTFDHVLLSFGDSLTKGYFKVNNAHRPSYHPYTIKLSALISHYWIDKGSNHAEDGTNIIEVGNNGEPTNVMLERFPSILKKYKPKVVCILGGTNDLHMMMHRGGSFQQVFNNLETMHYLAINSKADDGDLVYTIAITIPPCGFYSEDRLKINDRLRKLATRCSKRIGLVDLDAYTYFNISEGGDKYWTEDGVHLSKLGYDQLGQLIYDELTSKIVETHVVDTSSPVC